MLLLGSKGITVDGIQVFPDHADPNQFWYLPGPVELARRENREAIFTFIKYRPAAVEGGAKGGGFLTFVTDLRLDPHTESRILSKVAALATGEARLSAVEFDEGTVQCVALNLQGSGGTTASGPPGSFQAVQQILGASVPALFGDNDAAFSLTLSQDGATILEQAFEDGTSPVGVIYQLKFSGMRPALDVKITADYKRIYDEFSAGLQANVYWVSAGIEAGFEKLKQDGAIKIEVTNFTGEADLNQKEQWALDFFKEKLMADWFEPTLVPGQLSGGGAFGPGGLSSLDAMTRGGAVRPPGTTSPARPPGMQVPQASPTPAPGQHGGAGGSSPGPAAHAQPAPAAATPTPASPAPAGGTAAPANPASAASPTPASFTQGTGQGSAPRPNPAVAPHPAAPGGSPVATPGAPAAPAARPNPAAAGLGFNPTSPTNRQNPLANIGGAAQSSSPIGVALRLKFVHQEELKTMTFEYQRSDATQRMYAPQGFFGLLASDLDRTRGGAHFIEVDLDNPFFRVFSVDVQSPIDFARIGLTSAHVSLDYGDPAGDPQHLKHQDYVFDAAHKQDQTWQVFMDDRIDTTYRYSVEYNFDPESGWKAQTDEYQFAAVTTENRHLLLNPFDHLGFLEVRIFPNRIDKDAILETDVHLSYTAPGGWKQQDVITVIPDKDAQYWRLRLADKDATSYTYFFIHHLKDGSTIQTDPVVTAATAIPVDDPFAGGLDLTFVPLMDSGKVRFAFVDFLYDDPDNQYHREFRLQFGGDATNPINQHVSIRDPKKIGFQYRLTFEGKTGQEERRPYVDSQDTLIAVR